MDALASPITTDVEYTAEEQAFGVAVDAYRRMYGREFPTNREFLAIAKALGYRKVAPAENLPRFERNHE